MGEKLQPSRVHYKTIICILCYILTRFHKPSFAIVDEECGKWEALSNYVGKNGTVGDMIIMISAIQRAFKYSNDKGGLISEVVFHFNSILIKCPNSTLSL